jgi:tetratricopeptide (TPR) repeat protein
MKTSTGYMMASGQANIPTAYIVTSDFRIAWIGHPLFGLDEVLDQVLAGKFDVDKAAAEATADDKFFETRHTELLSAVQSSNWEGALKIAREIADPSHPCSKSLKIDILDNVSWLILTDPQKQTQNYKDALYLAKTALELSEGKNPSVLDTYGLALFENGEVQQAIDHARKALEMSYDMGFRIEVQQRLMRYQQALKAP